MFLKASTATYIQAGPYVSNDGVTAKMGLFISAGVFQISKNGEAFANKTHTGVAVSAPGGWYRVPLSAADVNTVGRLEYKSYQTPALPVWGAFKILPGSVYDAFVGGSGYLGVNAVQIEGVDATNQLSTAITTGMGEAAGAPEVAAAVKSLGINYVGSVGLVKKVNTNVMSATVFATGAFTNAKFAAGALSGGNLAATAKSSIGTAVWATTTRQLTGTQTFNVTGNITGNVTGSVGSVVALKANAVSAGVVADNVMTSIATAVWNRTLSLHSVAGTAGKRLDGIGIKKSTAFNDITFLMVDATDDITPKTGLSPTATVSRDAGSFAAAAGTVTEMASGYYQFDAASTDMSGGIVTFKFAADGANDTTITIRTVT